MNPVTHFLIGWTVANAVPVPKRDRGLITFASVIPDLDGLGLVAEIATRGSPKPLTWWSDYHHVLGHNIGFAVVVTLVFACLAKNKLLTPGLVLISFHLHLLGDLFGARGPDGEQWPIPYLLPFSNAWQLTWSGQWPLNAWPNVVITLTLIMWSLILARSRGYSPLEIFAGRADGVVVETLRRRFPMKS
jgi:inner membrane protein